MALLAIAFLAAGAGIGIVETAEHTAVATHSPEAVRGSACGLLAAVQAFGNLIASSTVGIIWTVIGPGIAFGIITVIMITAAILLRRAIDPNQAAKQSD